MSRHPFSRDWKGVIAYLVVAASVVAAVFMWTHSYLLAMGAILITTLGITIYLIGESSDLPGTSGDHNKNVRT